MKIVPFGESKNSKKIWAYYKALIKTEAFQKDVKKIRKKYNIPEAGFSKRESNIVDLSDDVSILCRKYNLFPGHGWITLEEYLYYSKIAEPDILSGELCTLWDFVEDPESSWQASTIRDLNAFYPLAIRISPYASQRDIVDFVKTHFESISFFQKKYIDNSNKIAKIRPKKVSIENRNDFIYENKKLSLKKLAELLYEKLNIDMDEGSISKIISLESKRRKKV